MTITIQLTVIGQGLSVIEILHNCTYVQLVGNSSRNEYSKTRSMVINPSSVTGKNLGTVLKKICEHHAGVEIRQTGISRQSGSSTHTVQFSILTENNLLLESYYFGHLRLIMEFPGDINVFDAVDFETESPAAPGAPLWSCSCRLGRPAGSPTTIAWLWAALPC